MVFLSKFNCFDVVEHQKRVKEENSCSCKTHRNTVHRNELQRKTLNYNLFHSSITLVQFCSTFISFFTAPFLTEYTSSLSLSLFQSRHFVYNFSPYARSTLTFRRSLCHRLQYSRGKIELRRTNGTYSRIYLSFKSFPC